MGANWAGAAQGRGIFDADTGMDSHVESNTSAKALMERLGQDDSLPIFTIASMEQLIEIMLDARDGDPDDPDDPETIQSAMDCTLALVDAVKPQNRQEAQLATQMAVIHKLSMAASKRAVITKGLTRRGKHINNAVKLSRLYLEQIAALERLKGDEK